MAGEGGEEDDVPLSNYHRKRKATVQSDEEVDIASANNPEASTENNTHDNSQGSANGDAA